MISKTKTLGEHVAEGEIAQATPPKKKPAGIEAFLRERARYLLAHVWCVEATNNNGVVRHIPQQGGDDYPSWEVAIKAEWVTGPSGRKPHGTVKQGGWFAAAAFLKR